MRNFKRRAIMLISVMLFSILTLMFATAAISLAPGGLARAETDASLASADRAARSGLEWVRSRISQDPQWRAVEVQKFRDEGLLVSEGEGQVVGWVTEQGEWSRFRLRFNYQDGPDGSDSRSDGMDDPSHLWTDFAYVSCNNLLGGSNRPLPVAQSGWSFSRASLWPEVQLTAPPNTLVLSLEGAHGKVKLAADGHPLDFQAAFHKRVAQVVLRLGENQPITAAAVMANGNLQVSSASPMTLQSVGSEAVRLRAKGDFALKGGAQSPGRGELMFPGGEQEPSTKVQGPLKNVTSKANDNTGLYKIPAEKVRTPASAASLPAGTYLVDEQGSLKYVEMEYTDYLKASPRPSGQAISLPSGLALTGPRTSGPKYSLVLNRDLQISPAQGAGGQRLTGFALVPEGGAPQSTDYGGVGVSEPPSRGSGGQWKRGWHEDDSYYGGGYYWWDWDSGPAEPVPSPPPGPPTAQARPSGLKPKDLELQLVGGANGVVLANDGDITIGAQIQSRGSALISKNDIRLVGTSNDFSSDRATQLGLNLYAQGSITLDPYDLDPQDPDGGVFHRVNLQGIVYAWKDINILSARGESGGPFVLKGAMVAYGGDPGGVATTGGNIRINASSVEITYDPKYVAGLAPTGPYALKILSWHQF